MLKKMFFVKSFYNVNINMQKAWKSKQAVLDLFPK